MNGIKRTQMIEAADLEIMNAVRQLNQGDRIRPVDGFLEAVELCRQAGMEGRAAAVLRLMERVICGHTPRWPDPAPDRTPWTLERVVDHWLAAAAGNAEAAK